MAHLVDPPKDPWIGRLIADGKYELSRFVANGAMGRVYEGRQRQQSRQVAIKLLHGSYQSDERMVARFKREADAARRIRHPNVVEILDIGEEPDGLLYLVMEYLDGKDLYRLITEQGPMPLHRAIDIIAQVCEAIGTAHERGVVHRDLKPQKIIVRQGRGEDGSPRDVVKVLDFGIAKIEDGHAQTMDLVAGTPEFMSPEQCRGDAVDARADVYSCGCLLYYLVTGIPPVTGETPVATIMNQVSQAARPPSELVPGLPEQFDVIAMQALAKDPDERYQNLRGLEADLLPLIGQQPSSRADAPAALGGGGLPLHLDEPDDSPTHPAHPALVDEQLPPEDSPRSKGWKVAGAAIGGLVAVLAAGAAFAFTLLSDDDDVGSGTVVAATGPATPPRDTDERVAESSGTGQGEPEADEPDDEAAIDDEAAATDAALEQDEPEAQAGARSRAERRRAAAARRRRLAMRRRNRRQRSSAQPSASTNGANADSASDGDHARGGSSDAERSEDGTQSEAQKSASVPDNVGVAIRRLEVSGGLDRSVVRRAVTGLAARYPQCYLEAARRAQRAGKQQLSVRFAIDGSGRARRVAVAGGTLPGLDTCVKGVVEHLEAAEPPESGSVEAKLRMEFMPR